MKPEQIAELRELEAWFRKWADLPAGGLQPLSLKAVLDALMRRGVAWRLSHAVAEVWPAPLATSCCSGHSGDYVLALLRAAQQAMNPAVEALARAEALERARSEEADR